MAQAYLQRVPSATGGLSAPTSRQPSPRGYNPRPDFREGSTLEEKDKMGRTVARYRVGRLLGRGGFAKCYAVVDEQQSEWAVKVIEKAVLQKNKMFSKMQTEISIHRRMKHPNIIDFRRTFSDEWNVYIILEKCDNQTLMEVSKTRRRFSIPETQWVMSQTLSALLYMHRQNVIHRDLKLGNMMLDRDMNVKIGDFGLAAELQYDGERKRTICGTPNYIAPEILQNSSGGHSFEVDVWSSGVILYTLLVGEPPFQTSDVKTTYSRIRQCRYSFPPHVDVPDAAKQLIQRMLQADPTRRPSLAAVRDDLFFRQTPVPTSAPLTLFPDHQRRQREQRQAPPAAVALPSRPVLAPRDPRPQNVVEAAKPSTRCDPVFVPSTRGAQQQQEHARRPSPRGMAAPASHDVPQTARPRSSSATGAIRQPGVALSEPVQRPGTSGGGGAAPSQQPPVPSWGEKPKSPTRRSGEPVVAAPAVQAPAGPSVPPRLEEDDRRHIDEAQDQLHQSLMAAPTGAPAAAAAPAVAPPAAWVTDYADFSGKYGMAYKLSTGHTGVHYNDSTKMVWEPTSNNVEYYARVKETINGVVHATDELSAFQMDSFPDTLNKKVTLIKYFKSYLARGRGRTNDVDVVKCSPFAMATAAQPLVTDAHMSSSMIYVKRWMITPRAIVFRLSNKAIQVCFNDKHEVILMSEQKTVAYTTPAGRRKVLPLAAVSSQSSDVATRLKYTRELLCQLISNHDI